MRYTFILSVFGILTFLLTSCGEKKSSKNSSEGDQQQVENKDEGSCFPEMNMYSSYENIEFHSDMLTEKFTDPESRVFGHAVSDKNDNHYMDWRMSGNCGIVYYFISVTFEGGYFGSEVKFSGIGSDHFLNLSGEVLIKVKDDFASLNTRPGQYPAGYTIYVCDGPYSFASDLRQSKLIGQ